MFGTGRGVVESVQGLSEICSGLVEGAAAASVDGYLLVGRGGGVEPLRSFVVVGDDAPVGVSTGHTGDKRVGGPGMESAADAWRGQLRCYLAQQLVTKPPAVD